MAYKGKCVGRIKDFISEYFYADEVTFEGDGKSISRNGNVIITYEWEEGTDIPVITFVNKDNQHIEERIKSERDRNLERFGWIKLDPNDSFEGTTGKYLEKHSGWA